MNITVYKIILTTVVLFYSVSALSQEYSNITLTLLDKDTGSPINNFKVDYIYPIFHNGFVDIKSRSLLGYTDECGYLSVCVPNSLAEFQSSVNTIKGTFKLLVTHCSYGETIVSYDIDGAPQEIIIERPFVYDVKVITNSTKKFIQLDVKARPSFVHIYEHCDGPFCGDYGLTLQYVLLLRPDYTGPHQFGWQASITDEGSYTFVDSSVVSPGLYTYYIQTAAGGPPGCGSMVDTISVNLSTELPDTISYLPLHKENCKTSEPPADCTPTATASYEASPLPFPIPYNDVLNVDLSQERPGEIVISILDTKGSLLFFQKLKSHSDIYSLDLSPLPVGIQYLKIETGNSVRAIKIAKYDKN